MSTDSTPCCLVLRHPLPDQSAAARELLGYENVHFRELTIKNVDFSIKPHLNLLGRAYEK